MWFPANYVEEIDSVVETVEPKPLGNLQQGTIDLTGVTVGLLESILMFHMILMIACTYVSHDSDDSLYLCFT